MTDYEQPPDGPEYFEDGWTAIQEALIRAELVNGTASISFSKKDGSQPGEWWLAYVGEVVDAGRSGGENWVDLRITSQTRTNYDAIAAEIEIDKDLRKTGDRPEDPELFTPDQLRHLAETHQLSREVQTIIGNIEELEIPDGVTRFSMSQIGRAFVLAIEED